MTRDDLNKARQLLRARGWRFVASVSTGGGANHNFSMLWARANEKFWLNVHTVQALFAKLERPEYGDCIPAIDTEDMGA